MLALQAFLSLFELTGDQSWVRAAAQAADYVETWTYSWSVPIPRDDPKVVYPVAGGRCVVGPGRVDTTPAAAQ